METEIEVINVETLHQQYGKVITEKAIAELKQKYEGLTIAGLEDKKGYSIVYAAYQEIKQLVTDIEKKRKELKADSLEYGKKVDAIAKQISEPLIELRDNLGGKRDEIDNEKQRLIQAEADRLKKEEEDRQEAIRKTEEEKQKKIQARQQALNRTGATLEDGVYSLGTISFLETDIECEEQYFHGILRNFSVESEKIKMAKEKEAAELKAKQEEIAEIERKQREEREALEREKEAIESEKCKIEKEKQDAIDAENRRIADEKAAKEQAEREEQLKKETAEKAIAEQKEKEAREKAEAEERAAQAPDKEKLIAFINKLEDIDFPTMKSKRYIAKINTAIKALQNIINDLK